MARLGWARQGRAPGYTHPTSKIPPDTSPLRTALAVTNFLDSLSSLFFPPVSGEKVHTVANKNCKQTPRSLLMPPKVRLIKRPGEHTHTNLSIQSKARCVFFHFQLAKDTRGGLHDIFPSFLFSSPVQC